MRSTPKRRALTFTELEAKVKAYGSSYMDGDSISARTNRLIYESAVTELNQHRRRHAARMRPYMEQTKRLPGF